MHTLQGSTGKREKKQKKKNNKFNQKCSFHAASLALVERRFLQPLLTGGRGESGEGFGGMLGHGSCCLRFCELIWQPVSAHFSGTYAHKRKTEVISTKLPDKQRESVPEVGVVMEGWGMTGKGMLMGLVTSLAAI